MKEASENVAIVIVAKLDHENVAIAVGISTVSGLEREIHLWDNSTPTLQNSAVEKELQYKGYPKPIMFLQMR